MWQNPYDSRQHITDSREAPASCWHRWQISQLWRVKIGQSTARPCAADCERGSWPVIPSQCVSRERRRDVRTEDPDARRQLDLPGVLPQLGMLPVRQLVREACRVGLRPAFRRPKGTLRRGCEWGPWMEVRARGDARRLGATLAPGAERYAAARAPEFAAASRDPRRCSCAPRDHTALAGVNVSVAPWCDGRFSGVHQMAGLGCPPRCPTVSLLG